MNAAREIRGGRTGLYAWGCEWEVFLPPRFKQGLKIMVENITAMS